MRPSGANFRERGKLRPVRIVVTGEAVEGWASENIQEPVESMINVTIFAVSFREETQVPYDNPQRMCRNESEKVCEVKLGSYLKGNREFFLSHRFHNPSSSRQSHRRPESETTRNCCKLNCPI